MRNVLEQTPPELSSDIIDKGMVMTGGGSLLRNIDALLTQVTGIPCHVAENALNSVAVGTGLALEHFGPVPQEPGERLVTARAVRPGADGRAGRAGRHAATESGPDAAARLAFADFHIHTRFSRDSILSEEQVHPRRAGARPDPRGGHQPQQRGGGGRRPRQGARSWA